MTNTSKRTVRFFRYFLTCLFVLNSSAIADSYHCTFKPRSVEKGMMPATLHIEWPDYLKPAHITDTITTANGFKNVLATNPVENPKRVTFRWKLTQIHVPNLSRIVGSGRNKVDMDYSATVFPASGKVVLTATPGMQLNGIGNGTVRSQGRCKLIS